MVPGFIISDDDAPKTEAEKVEVAKLPCRQIIGSLWWLAGVSRPDIVMATHYASTWTSKKLWDLLMRILRYLAKTKLLGLCFSRTDFKEVVLEAFVDASFAGESGFKSRFGYFYFFNGALVSWASQSTSRVVTSSTEAEVNGLVQLGKEREYMGKRIPIGS